ncbi:MAG: 23S rRNA (uracil(1939)-C(5))-methyltransferase RlmD [Eubacteriales bacterium]|nr:23S rRNA (uracil(1939)-C(5))-methyltransferase RlmD [Eubacteriales bacterium]
MAKSTFNETDKSIQCPYALNCGACSYAGMTYEGELKVKDAQIKKIFEGLCDFPHINGMYRPVYYRNKVHAVVSGNKENPIITGTYEEGTHNVVAVKQCLIEDKQCNDIMDTLRSLFVSFKYKPYDEDTKRGFIRHILMRKGFSTKEIMVVLVTGEVMFPSKNNFIKALLEAHPEITTIVQNVNNMGSSMVLGSRSIVLYGKGYIEDVLCGFRFRISPSSFYQINPAQTEKLYKAAIKMADLTKKDTLIDAYCGIGTIGIAASKSAGQVIGVELNREAVHDAQINAQLNNISNIKFVNEDAGEFLVAYAARHKADVVIMDPPRSGSTPEFLDSLIKITPSRIVYISCNPETQARDLKVLVKGGYEIKQAAAYDLFPHTSHVESVVLMSRKEK